jgi:hypothetical protein
MFISASGMFGSALLMALLQYVLQNAFPDLEYTLGLLFMYLIPLVMSMASVQYQTKLESGK